MSAHSSPELDRLVRSAARREAKDAMRREPSVRAPGLVLPWAIAVPHGGLGFRYTRTDKATWAQLVAGLLVRRKHVRAAEAKLDQYDDALDTLRPLMADDEERTVAEALRRHRGAA